MARIDHDFRSFGRGDMGETTVFDLYAMANTPRMTQETMDEIFAHGEREYKKRLAKKRKRDAATS